MASSGELNVHRVRSPIRCGDGILLIDPDYQQHITTNLLVILFSWKFKHLLYIYFIFYFGSSANLPIEISDLIPER